jgi:AcrR family transcriptional regulator
LADIRIERTRAALAAAVIELCAEREFSTVTVNDIVARAGVGYATFFRHYRDKTALLLEVADRLSDEIIPAMLPALLEDDTKAASVALCQHVEANRGACQALFSDAAGPKVRRLLTEHAIGRGLAVELPDPEGLPPLLAITHSVHSILSLLGWWLEQGAHLDAHEMAAIIDRLVMGPVRGR